MGCCFRKELSLQNESSSLLQPPLHHGPPEVTQRLRLHAEALAQHVSFQEEGTHVAHRGAQRKAEEDEEPSGPDNNTATKTRVDGGSQRERQLKPASAHEENEAILITAGTNVHADTNGGGPGCEPAPYMEVITHSPVRQKILENASLRASWFSQLPGGQEPQEPGSCWSAAARPPPLVDTCEVTPRDSLSEKEEEACVVTTLCQGFGERTQSFYSLVSIDAEDLEPENDQQTAGGTRRPCSVEVLVRSQPSAEALPASFYTGEPKTNSQTCEQEPEPPTCRDQQVEVDGEAVSRSEVMEQRVCLVGHLDVADHLQDDVRMSGQKLLCVCGGHSGREADGKEAAPAPTVPAVETPPPEPADVTSHSDESEFSTTEPPFTACCHGDAGFGNWDETLDSSDVKTEGAAASGPEQRSGRQEGIKMKPEPFHVEGGAATVGSTETGQNLSSLETSDDTEDPEDPERGVEDSGVSPVTQPPLEDVLRSSAGSDGVTGQSESSLTQTETCWEEPAAAQEAQARVHSETFCGTTEVHSDTSACDVFTDHSSFRCHGDHEEDRTMITVDPAQIDIHASTPSYEIHFLGQDVPPAAEEGEGGMREMVSELLGEDADSPACLLHPHTWIKLGLEDGCGGWAQGACGTKPGRGESSAERIPESVSELQPSMALLGAFPFSTVTPQGLCVWEWHSDGARPVSVKTRRRAAGLVQ